MSGEIEIARSVDRNAIRAVDPVAAEVRAVNECVSCRIEFRDIDVGATCVVAPAAALLGGKAPDDRELCRRSASGGIKAACRVDGNNVSVSRARIRSAKIRCVNQRVALSIEFRVVGTAVRVGNTALFRRESADARQILRCCIGPDVDLALRIDRHRRRPFEIAAGEVGRVHKGRAAGIDLADKNRRIAGRRTALSWSSPPTTGNA